MRPGGQRGKEKAFERKIAAVIGARWPGALVRRASHAERAHNPDVFVEGGPKLLHRLWIELQDSATATPAKKLAHAVRDVERDPKTTSDDRGVYENLSAYRAVRNIADYLLSWRSFSRNLVIDDGICAPI